MQRILMELLTQMDGFEQNTNVKVIMATNRADTLDPALLRPGRLDRKIEFPLPDRRQKRLVFQVGGWVGAAVCAGGGGGGAPPRCGVCVGCGSCVTCFAASARTLPPSHAPTSLSPPTGTLCALLLPHRSLRHTPHRTPTRTPTTGLHLQDEPQRGGGPGRLCVAPRQNQQRRDLLHLPGAARRGAARRGWGGQRGGAVERCGGAGPCRSRGEV